MDETSNDEIKSFFESSPPLMDAEEIKLKTEEFLQKNSLSEASRRIVLVTSGGTTVPLEQRCVRYINNFCFCRAGYAVVFLYRVGICQPFCRSLPNNALLECFDVDSESNIITVHLVYEKTVKEAISYTHAATNRGTLLKLPFTAIFEYLKNLQLIASSMSSLGSNALFYLAAAVSNFYVPWESMAVHKIQSSSGPLDMRLVQVQKMLSVLRKDWAPQAFFISFKLETDKMILLEKAGISLKKYNMDKWL